MSIVHDGHFQTLEGLLMRRFVALLLACAGMACGGSSVVENEDPGLVSLAGALSNRFVPAGTETELLAQIRVGTDNASIRGRSPVNVALVVDTSGSMEGDPIQHAREASLALLESLGDGDRLSVVAFHSRADVLLESTALEDSDLDELRRKVGAMEARGTTDLEAGLQVGLEQLMSHLFYEGINRIVLLSDGVPNQEGSIVALAQAAGERNITITALGLGRDYNETLLGQIAQLSGGSFHYIEDSEAVVAVFRNEVLRMQQVYGRNAVVSIRPGPGVRIDSVVGQNVSQDGAVVRVLLGDLTQGELRDLIVRATVAGHRDGASVEALDVELTFDDAIAEAGRLTRNVFLGAKATANAAELASGRNASVEAAAERVQAAAVTIQAISLVRDGDLERARAVLQSAETRARNYAEQSQDERVRRQAAQMRSLDAAISGMQADPAYRSEPEDEEAGPAGAEPTTSPEAPPPSMPAPVRETHEEAMDTLGF
jgi:Ca-activated chloride channel homolog